MMDVTHRQSQPVWFGGLVAIANCCTPGDSCRPSGLIDMDLSQQKKIYSNARVTEAKHPGLRMFKQAQQQHRYLR